MKLMSFGFKFNRQKTSRLQDVPVSNVIIVNSFVEAIGFIRMCDRQQSRCNQCGRRSWIVHRFWRCFHSCHHCDDAGCCGCCCCEQKQRLLNSRRRCCPSHLKRLLWATLILNYQEHAMWPSLLSTADRTTTDTSVRWISAVTPPEFRFLMHLRRSERLASLCDVP